MKSQIPETTTNPPIKNQPLLVSLFRFIFRPNYGITPIKESSLTKFWDMIRLWSLTFFISFFLGILITVLLLVFNYDEEQNVVVETILNEPLYVTLFFALLWAPIVEELTFRLGLKFSPYGLSFSIAFVLILLISMLPDWFFAYPDLMAPALYLGFLPLTGLGLGFVFKKKFDFEKVSSFYTKYFGLIFYLLAFFFAATHLLNYSGLEQIWFLAPLLVLPQFIFGLNLGFVRMRYGLKWSIVNHFIHNGISISPTVVFTFLSEDFNNVLNDPNATQFPNLSQNDKTILAIGGIFGLLIILVILLALAHLFGELIFRKPD